MSVLITDLPQDIRERAEKNKKDPKCNTWAGKVYNDGDIDDFVWDKTDEGQAFWHLVSFGKFDEARALLNGENEGV